MNGPDERKYVEQGCKLFLRNDEDSDYTITVQVVQRILNEMEDLVMVQPKKGQECRHGERTTRHQR